jgi:hypothetical protein
MKNYTVTWSATFTDTFAGQANYSWVRRAEFTTDGGASRREVVTKAKRALGLTGVACKTEEHGEGFQLRPVNSLTVVFINPNY